MPGDFQLTGEMLMKNSTAGINGTVFLGCNDIKRYKGPRKSARARAPPPSRDADPPRDVDRARVRDLTSPTDEPDCSPSLDVPKSSGMARVRAKSAASRSLWRSVRKSVHRRARKTAVCTALCERRVTPKLRPKTSTAMGCRRRK